MDLNYKLTIGWLYPDLMSTYGDRGNIEVLKKRAQWNNIKVDILPVQQNTTVDEINKVDLIFGGGSQDLQQEIVMRDLKGAKGNVLKDLIKKNIPALFVCGSPQLMGKYYEPAYGTRIEGLGIFDMVSINPGPNKTRCIGNIIGEVQWNNIDPAFHPQTKIVVGFENHGGRTYLGKDIKPFAKVIKGYGNNGEDGTEGMVYKNAIGCYFHGPLLPKNAEIADYLLQKALQIKYKKPIYFQTDQIVDILERRAKQVVMARYNIT